MTLQLSATKIESIDNRAWFFMGDLGSDHNFTIRIPRMYVQVKFSYF